MYSLSKDSLFLGLTRPTAILGVSVQYAMLNMMVSLTFFIQTSNFFVLPIAFLIHIIGYIASFKEPRFLELYMNKIQNFNTCYNRSYFGANSYSVW